jgi:hypothetical protein
MDSTMQLSRDFSEFVDACSARGVRFLVVGGYAVAAHGHPRMTKDLDVLVDPARDNADRLVAALGDFGFGSVGLVAEDFIAPGEVVQLGYPPVRIDLLTSLDGVEFDAAYAGRVDVDIDGRSIPVIGRAELIANKRATGRLQDLADVERLEADAP